MKVFMNWCFNGATTFQPWKQNGGLFVHDWEEQLQWGHDFSAVETISDL